MDDLEYTSLGQQATAEGVKSATCDSILPRTRYLFLAGGLGETTPAVLTETSPSRQMLMHRDD